MSTSPNAAPRPRIMNTAPFNGRLIRYGAGRITIADRLGLEKATCECYAATRRALDRVFGRDRPDAGKA